MHEAVQEEETQTAEWKKVLSFEDVGLFMKFAAQMDGYEHTEMKTVDGQAHAEVRIRGTKDSVQQKIHEMYEMKWQATQGGTGVRLTETEEYTRETDAPRNGQTRKCTKTEGRDSKRGSQDGCSPTEMKDEN